jgi:hypothetical protein
MCVSERNEINYMDEREREMKKMFPGRREVEAKTRRAKMKYLMEKMAFYDTQQTFILQKAFRMAQRPCDDDLRRLAKVIGVEEKGPTGIQELKTWFKLARADVRRKKCQRPLCHYDCDLSH